MKVQIRKPESGKTHYSEKYKQQALDLWQASGRSAAKVGAELGICPALIFPWTARRGQVFMFNICDGGPRHGVR